MTKMFYAVSPRPPTCSPTIRRWRLAPASVRLPSICWRRSTNFTAIEKDKRLHAHLRERFQDNEILRLIHADALKYFANDEVDWSNWKLCLEFAANVASPLLADLAAMPRGPQRLVVTVQWEVGQRLAAQHATREYSKLTLLVGCRYELKEIFKISRTVSFLNRAYTPPVFTLDRCPEPLYPDALHKPFTTVVKRAFSQRRKMMRKNLKGGWPEDQLDAAFAAVNLDSKNSRRESNPRAICGPCEGVA